MVYDIVSFTYKFQHQLKFQSMLRDIGDGTMCVLQTLTVFVIQCGMNPIDENYQRLEQWASRMHPPYNEFKRYAGKSRYITQFEVICSSKQLQKKM